MDPIPPPIDSSSRQHNRRDSPKQIRPAAPEKLMQEVALQNASDSAPHTKEVVAKQPDHLVEGQEKAQKTQEAAALLLSQTTPQSRLEATATSLNRERGNQIDSARLERSFATITRNIPNCQQMLLNHGRTAEVAQLERDMDMRQGNNWDEIIRRYKDKPANLALDGLKALQDGAISIEQFCTITYVYALMKEFPDAEIYVQPLFEEDGTVDASIDQVIQKGFYKTQHKNFFHASAVKDLKEAFFVEMEDKAPSEQCFFFIDYSRLEKNRETMTAALKMSVGLHLFNRFSLENNIQGKEPMRMVPSFSMMQACIDAYGKENNVLLFPTIGVSTRADFRRNADQATREMFTPFPDFPCPPIADGIDVLDSLEFISHDFFHGLVCSQVPDHLRRETGRVADCIEILQKRLKDSPETMTGPFLETFYGRMVDMEFSLFRRENLDSLRAEEVFLVTLEMQALRNTYSRLNIKLKSLPSETQRTALTQAAQENLQKWDQLRSKVSLQKDLPTLFYAFCKESDILKHIAEILYQDGFFHRLNISEESFRNAKTFIENAGFDYRKTFPGVSFLDHLMDTYRSRSKEGKDH